MDESASVGAANYLELLAFIKQFAARFDLNLTRWGVIEFSGEDRYLEEYPNVNLTDVAIQQTINLFDNRENISDFNEAIDGLKYTPIDPDHCNTTGHPVLPGQTSCKPQRWYTCISCAFQFALQEYFPEAGNVLDDGRNRTIIFVGDGKGNRGSPVSPTEPVNALREQFPFQMIFVPVLGNEGIDEDIFGSAFLDDDVLVEVQSYSDLALLPDLGFEC